MSQAKVLISSAAMAISACSGSSTAQARFLQVDPVGYQDQVNLYAYVGNDPTNASDPTGTVCVPQKDGSSVCDRRARTSAGSQFLQRKTQDTLAQTRGGTMFTTLKRRHPRRRLD